MTYVLLFVLTVVLPFMPTTGIPNTLQRVQIGEVPLIPDTATTPPIALAYRPPVYTREALLNGVEGTVTLRAEFDIDGNVRVLDVAEGLGYGLDEVALSTVKTWRFRPAYRSGRRVAVVADVDVEFAIQEVDDALLSRAYGDLERGHFTRARLLLSTLTTSFPTSRHVPAARFGMGESLYRQGTPGALTQAASEFSEFLRFFPNSDLADSARRRIDEAQAVLDRPVIQP